MQTISSRGPYRPGDLLFPMTFGVLVLAYNALLHCECKLSLVVGRPALGIYLQSLCSAFVAWAFLPIWNIIIIALMHVYGVRLCS
jgi:hypothetical protein